MSNWHPILNAHPSEWLMRTANSEPPYAVIRRIMLEKDEWFRVVTFHEPRELIGWSRTLEDAAAAGWDFFCAAESWRHGMASRRQGVTERPAAHDLLMAYRAAKQQRAPDLS